MRFKWNYPITPNMGETILPPDTIGSQTKSPVPGMGGFLSGQ